MAWHPTNEAVVSIVAETVIGTTPTTPAFRKVRLTGEDMATQAEQIRSAEIIAGTNRGVADSILAGARSEGSISAELCANTVFEDLLASLLGGVWAANAVTPGVTYASFTLERHVGLDTSYDWYHRYTGMMAGKLDLDIAPNQIVTASWGLRSRGVAVVDTATIAGATYAEPSPARNIAPAFTGPLASVTWGGGLSGIGTPYTPKLSLSIDSGLRGIQTIGTLGDAEQVLGRLVITGSATIYAADNTILSAFLAATEGTLSIVLSDAAVTPNHHTLTYALARVKITQCKIVAAAVDTDVVAEIEFESLVPASGAQITVTRATS